MFGRAALSGGSAFQLSITLSSKSEVAPTPSAATEKSVIARIRIAKNLRGVRVSNRSTRPQICLDAQGDHRAVEFLAAGDFAYIKIILFNLI